MAMRLEPSPFVSHKTTTLDSVTSLVVMPCQQATTLLMVMMNTTTGHRGLLTRMERNRPMGTSSAL